MSTNQLHQSYERQPTAIGIGKACGRQAQGSMQIDE